MSLLVNHFRFRPWPNARNIIRTGVFGNSVLVPAQVQNDAVIGSSGDARIVRCQAKADGSGTYWAKTKPGEIAFAGLARVEQLNANVASSSGWSASDPTKVSFTDDSTISPPVPGLTPVKIWRAQSGTTNRSVTAQSLNNLPRSTTLHFQMYVRLSSAFVNALQTNYGTGLQPIGYAYSGTSYSVSSRLMVSSAMAADTWYLLYNEYNTQGTSDDWVILQPWGNFDTTDPSEFVNAPMWVAGPMVWMNGPGFPLDRIIDPSMSYGFGANGVLYYATETGLQAGTDTIVTDTGQRTPLVGGGLVAAKAETNVVSPSHTTSTEGWTLDTSASWQGAGTALPGLPAPEGFKGDGIDTSVNADNSGTLSTALNDKLYMHAVAEVVGGATGEDSECSIRDTSGTALAQVYLRKGTGPVYSGGFVYSDYQAAAGPNGGDLYEFIIEATETASSSTRVFRCYSDAGVASQKVLYLHHAYLGKERPSPYLLLHSSSGTAAVSRTADDVPIDVKAGVRARAAVTLDLSTGIIAGPVLSGEKTDGNKFDMLVLNSNGTLTITDPGGATYTTTNAVSAAVDQEIRFDAGATGLTIRINSNEETSATAFDFNSMVRVRPGHRPDTNTAVGIPFTTIHWGVF